MTALTILVTVAALDAFRHHITTPADLEKAIAACRNLNYDYKFTAARTALHLATVGAQ